MITLKTLHLATAQEVFDQVVNHLLTQNARSTDKWNKCVYRSKDGLKCAAGCLIGVDEYNPGMEYNPWSFLVRLQKVPNDHKFLISDLQHIHDNVKVESWKGRLKKLAKNYKLSYDVINSF